MNYHSAWPDPVSVSAAQVITKLHVPERTTIPDFEIFAGPRPSLT